MNREHLLERVIEDIARVTGLGLADLLERDRRGHVVPARRALAWLLVEVGGLSIRATAKRMQRDRASVLFAHRRALVEADSRAVILAVLDGW